MQEFAANDYRSVCRGACPRSIHRPGAVRIRQPQIAPCLLVFGPSWCCAGVGLSLVNPDCDPAGTAPSSTAQDGQPDGRTAEEAPAHVLTTSCMASLFNESTAAGGGIQEQQCSGWSEPGAAAGRPSKKERKRSNGCRKGWRKSRRLVPPTDNGHNNIILLAHHHNNNNSGAKLDCQKKIRRLHFSTEPATQSSTIPRISALLRLKPAASSRNVSDSLLRLAAHKSAPPRISPR